MRFILLVGLALVVGLVGAADTPVAFVGTAEAGCPTCYLCQTQGVCVGLNCRIYPDGWVHCW